MNTEYVVRFSGFSEKAKGKLDRMLADDIAEYPKRMSMNAASVLKTQRVSPKREAKPTGLGHEPPEPKPVKVVKKGRANAQS